MSQKAININR